MDIKFAEVYGHVVKTEVKLEKKKERKFIAEASFSYNFFFKIFLFIKIITAILQSHFTL